VASPGHQVLQLLPSGLRLALRLGSSSGHGVLKVPSCVQLSMQMLLIGSNSPYTYGIPATQSLY
jgi:hypothetical protein